MTKFSDRVGRIATSSTLAVLMIAEQYRARGIDMVDFGPGEPDFPTRRSTSSAPRFKRWSKILRNMLRLSEFCRCAKRSRSGDGAQFGSGYDATECIFRFWRQAFAFQRVERAGSDWRRSSDSGSLLGKFSGHGEVHRCNSHLRGNARGRWLHIARSRCSESHHASHENDHRQLAE